MTTPNPLPDPVTRHRHGIPTPRAAAAMATTRACRDCTFPYHYTTGHTNPRYCPDCLPGHQRLCRVCHQRFDITTDTDRLCPTHQVHATLF